MSDRTNEEKLRILQERLSTNSRKKKKYINKLKLITINMLLVFEEDLVNKRKIEPILPTPREPRNKRNGIKYFIIFFILSLFIWNISICRFGIDIFF